MAKRTINGEVYERTLVLDRANADEEARTVPAALSSEVEVPRWFGKEMLLHDAENIDLSRASDGLPMLFNHNRDMPIGIIRDIKIDTSERKLRGTLHFSKNAKASEVWSDVRDGYLKDISIGYRIQKWEEEADSDLVRITRWQLNEASVVTVPADHTVGINRSETGGHDMPDTPETQGGEGSARSDDVVNVKEFKITREKNRKEGEQLGIKAERKRIREIRELFEPHLERGGEYSDLMNDCIDRGSNLVQAQKALLDLYGGEAMPISQSFEQSEDTGSMDRASSQDVSRATRTPAGGRVSGGKDAVDNFVEGATSALLVRCGVSRDDKEKQTARENEFYSMKLYELAREYLRITNTSTKGLDQRSLVGKAFTREGIISHGTSDFANLTANVANKALLIGYNEAPETWSTWCRIGSLPDFRTGTRVNMSTFSDLEIVYENGEYKSGTFSDLKETLTLATYGKKFSISRQCIINDDTDALGRIPMSMGRAANRQIGDLAYAVLTSNPTLNQDNTAVFATGHSNYVTAGAAPSVTTLETAFTAMATQTDPGGATLNIMPAYLLVPHALRSTAQVLATAQYDPAGTAGTLTPNTVMGRFEVVADARLDTANSSGWYLAGNQNTYDTVEVAFLDGNSTPFMEQQDGWNVDGVEFKVRIDAVAAALDYRALYYNDGVT